MVLNFHLSALKEFLREKSAVLCKSMSVAAYLFFIYEIQEIVFHQTSRLLAENTTRSPGHAAEYLL